jgi:hypothetical protein
MVVDVFRAGGEPLEMCIGGLLRVRGRPVHLWGEGFEIDSHSCEVEMAIGGEIVPRHID